MKKKLARRLKEKPVRLKKDEVSLPPPEEEKRCTGHCCKRFTLPHSLTTMWAMYDDWLRGSGARRAFANDIHIVTPMLIFIEETDTSPADGAKFFDGGTRYVYTCKHFDEKSGNCGIYAHRPRMCEDYPYGNKCTYTDCTRKEKSPFVSSDLVQLQTPGQKLRPQGDHEIEEEGEYLAEVVAGKDEKG